MSGGQVGGRRRTIPMPGSWSERGRCGTHPVDLWNSNREEARRIAAGICSTCPVQEPCRTWSEGLPRSDRWGVVGGVDYTTAREHKKRGKP